MKTRISHERIKWWSLIFWLTTVFGIFLYVWLSEVRLVEIVRAIFLYTTSSYIGPLWFIALYAIRPLLFLPVVFLSSLGGMMFGFWPGLIYVLTGETISCSIAYFIGKYFGADFIKDDADHLSSRIKRHVQHHPFFAVLMMRLAFLPYEVVDYASAIFGARFYPYFMATFIGSIPGAITLTSVGASIKNVEDVRLSLLEIDERQAFWTLAFAVISLAIAVGAHFWYTKHTRVQKRPE